MFSLGSSHSYYLYRAACDMRKSFDSLSGLVRNELGRDPASGEVFVFINKRRNSVKLLHWERDGFVRGTPSCITSVWRKVAGTRHLYVTEYIIHKFWQWKHIILARTGADVRGDSGTTYASKSTIYQVKKVKLI